MQSIGELSPDWFIWPKEAEDEAWGAMLIDKERLPSGGCAERVGSTVVSSIRDKILIILE